MVQVTAASEQERGLAAVATTVVVVEKLAIADWRLRARGTGGRSHLSGLPRIDFASSPDAETTLRFAHRSRGASTDPPDGTHGVIRDASWNILT
jgi:hypothetical protein